MGANELTNDDDLAFLRRAFDLARRVRQRGCHPFGALLVAADRTVLIECENGFLPDRDATAHAERF
jgi:tRNA(Arg) A34 adenosine deaminase TadA